MGTQILRYVHPFDFQANERDEMLAFMSEIQAEGGKIELQGDSEYIVNEDGSYTVHIVMERVVDFD